MKNQGFSKIRSRLKSLKVPILILLTGIFLISILYGDARKDALEQLRKQFVIDAATRANIIHGALKDHLLDLEGLHSFYNSSTSLTRKAFAAFVAPTLKTRPGIQAFEWIPRVAYPERARYEAEARRDGLHGYQIYQLDPKGNKVAVGPRQYYYPVYYVEPLARNEFALGFDLGSNPARLAALDQAADTGQPVATEGLTLVQETGTQAGFLIFIPVYRQEMPLTTAEQRRMALQGFVLGVFRAGDAVEAAIRSSPEKGLLTELVDLYGPLDARLLYRFERDQLSLKVPTWKTLLAPTVTLGYEYPFTYPSRQWRVDIIASPAYVQGHISLSYWLIPPTGVLLTLLLALYFRDLLSHKERAEKLVAERTAELVQANEMMQAEITERKQADEKFLKEKQVSDTIIASLPGVFYFFNDQGFLRWNNNFEQVAGYSAAEIAELTPLDFFAGEDKDLIAQAIQEVYLRGANTAEAELVTKNGSRIPYFFTGRRLDLDGTPCLIGMGIDITERKQAEYELRLKEKLLDDAGDSIFLHDLEGNFLYVNEAAYRDRGYEKEELLAIDLSKIVAPEFAGLRKKRLNDLLDKGVMVFESAHCRKDGSHMPVEIHARIIDLNNMKLFLMVARDITARKRDEEALRQSEEKYRQLVQQIPMVVYKGYTDWSLKCFDQKIEEITGYSMEKFNTRQKTWLDMIFPEDVDQAKKLFKAALKGDGSYVTEHRIRKETGEIRWIQARNRIIRAAAGKVDYISGVFFDITERKGLEDQLIKAQKMEAVGILAGGIAHDFNNILMAILGNIGLAMLDAKTEPQVQDRLSQAEQACLRAQALSGQLLTFAKGGAPIKKIVSIANSLKESAILTLSGSKSRYEMSIPDDLWSVEADEGQINQIINNLLINADQAMPEGGIIKITAENCLVEAASNLPISKGKYVKFAIADQGVGISLKYLDKIFDPYFSTKQKGSGLGLATTYSIIKNHSGHIQVKSQTGFGTTFYIYLPATDKRVPADEPEKVKPTMGQGKVLVMDDEEMVREVLGSMLARLGYEVEFARDGGEAIEMFVQAHGLGQAFAAVILDLTVPGAMGGKETMARLLEIDPQVKAIVSSGYSDDPIMADFQKYGFSGVIAKPYKISELGKILQKVAMGKQ
jgi:PAS domain S-box-containing protein